MVDERQRHELARAVAAVRRVQAVERCGMGITLDGPEGERFVQWTEASPPGTVRVEVGVAGLGADQLDELTALGFGPFPDDRLRDVVWARTEPFPAAELEHLVASIAGVYELERLQLAIYPEDLVTPEALEEPLPLGAPASGNGQVEGLPRPVIDARASTTELRQLLDELPAGAADALAARARPAVVFATRRLDAGEPVPAGGSRFGGLPDLPAGQDWPAWQPGGAGPARPLVFLAQLALDGTAAATDLPLPPSGLLSFFCDLDDAGSLDGDGGSSQVLQLSTHDLSPRRGPEGLPVLPAALLQPIAVTTTPDPDDLGLDLDDDAYDAADQALLTRVGGAAPPGWRVGGLHQLGGYARAIQGPVEEEALQAARGVYRSDGGFDHARWASVKHQAAGWRLVFQLDSDDGLEVRWGDAGTLYWVAPLDAVAAGGWDEVRLVFQCH